MPDKIESPEDDDTQKNSANDSKDDAGDSSKVAPENHRQDIFEEKFQALMNGFGEACQKEGVNVAITIASHPELDQPIVFYRANHIAEAGALMAGVLRQIKSELFADLDTEPR